MITVQLVSSLTRLDLTNKENMFFVRCVAADSKLLKLETSCTVILPPTVCVLWSVQSTKAFTNTFTLSLSLFVESIYTWNVYLPFYGVGGRGEFRKLWSSFSVTPGPSLRPSATEASLWTTAFRLQNTSTLVGL